MNYLVILRSWQTLQRWTIYYGLRSDCDFVPLCDIDDVADEHPHEDHDYNQGNDDAAPVIHLGLAFGSQEVAVGELVDQGKDSTHSLHVV